MQRDMQIPTRKWAQGAFAINMQKDWAYEEPTFVKQKILEEMWGIKTREELLKMVEDLTTIKAHPDVEKFDDDENDSEVSMDAWNWIRSISLLRMAVAVGFMTNEESWKRIERIRPMLQARYGSWEEMAWDYLRIKQMWLLSNYEYSPEKTKEWETEQRRAIEELQQTLWSEVKFR